MNHDDLMPLSDAELARELGTALPGKEVISLLDLNVDLDLVLDLAAPVDLAVAANANVVAPIDAAVGANVLSENSTAATLADQTVKISQGISGEAIATSTQDSGLDQSDGGSDAAAGAGAVAGAGAFAQAHPAGAVGSTADPGSGLAAGDATGGTKVSALPELPNTSDLLSGNLLNVDVKVDLDADLAAPVNGAIAANANVAAPIDAAVAANIGSVDSEAQAVAKQTAEISQNLDNVRAEATANQSSDIEQ